MILTIMIFRILLGVLLLTMQYGVSQVPQLTDKSQVSVITCAVGEELYYAFGHSAFRVQDSVLGIDLVYNYGTFDFNRPNFYLNFAKGKLLYSLSRTSFDQFLWTYEQEKRSVRTQVLALTLEERNQIFAFLENNYLPQNRHYLYDPLWYNCSSIITTILKEQLGESLVFDHSHLERRYTFRELVRQYLHTNSWMAIGIDILFGAVVDRKATVQEHTFLPYYTMRQIRNTTKAEKPLLQEEYTILDYKEHRNSPFFLFSPLFVFSLLLLLTGIITYRNLKRGTRSRWFDIGLFLLSGLIGIALLVLWLATDHTSTVMNFDVLWAFPLNFVMAFVLMLPVKYIRRLRHYLQLLLGLLCVLLILWVVGVQQFSLILLPLLFTLVLRYVYLLYQIKALMDTSISIKNH